MKIPTKMPRLKGYRFPREVVAYAVWAYHRFALSTADVEDLLAERGVTVSRETVRKWVNWFGKHFADCIKRDRPTAADKWHLDEVVVPINGVKQWLWRAVDTNGDVLDILVQPRRNAKAAKRFLARLTVVSSWGCLGLEVERRSYRLITGTRVPHRVPSPTLRIGMFRALSFSLPILPTIQVGVAMTALAMAQMKPTISRAMAVVTTTFALPPATRWR